MKKIIGLNSALLRASYHSFFVAKFENKGEKFFIAIDQQSTKDHKPMVQIFLSEQSKEVEFQKMLLERYHCKEIMITDEDDVSYVKPAGNQIERVISEESIKKLSGLEPAKSPVAASANPLDSQELKLQ